MKKLLIVLCFILVHFINSAKEAGFSFEYADSLRENANAIVLFSKVTYTRTSLSNLTEHVHYAMTILSDRDDDLKEFSISYDAFTKVKALECTIYDKNGDKVRTLKKTEIKDYAAYSSYTLFHDNRYKYFEAYHPDYPYTIEIEYSIDHDGFLSIPTWYPIGDYNISIKESVLEAYFADDLKINFELRNASELAFEKGVEKNNTVFHWQINGVKALEYEKYAPPFMNQVPSVYLNPVRFIFDGVKGEFSSWNSLGEWNYRLLADDFDLSEDTKKDLDAIKKKSGDSHELVKLVYQYMQSKTRYVGIQLGIGGFKPMSPELVDEVGYGDCKALSYYTKSLLQYLDIQSDYAIVGVDRREIIFDHFPSLNQLNHAILCVPLSSDTVWLECTSQIAPYNHLYDGTTSRKAVLVKEGGGELVHTPNAKAGRAEQFVSITFDEDGKVSFKKKTKYTGSMFDDYCSLEQLSDKELREYELKSTTVNDMKINSMSVSSNPDEASLIVINDFVSNNFMMKSGNRLFLELNPFTQVTKIAGQKAERRNKVYIKNDLIYYDQIVFALPLGYDVEHCPENKSFSTKFGDFEMSIELNGNSLLFNRTFRITEGEYEKSNYTDYIEFVNKVAENEDCKLILIKT
ncbi:MAG: DUF3857 domain-containing protein [Prolixibacteraceae bacterium]